MGLFDQFPYTNFHELNLDWVLQALKELEHTIEQFVAINALKYADPIQWDITSQYEKNTIVIDPQSGTAYISVQPVPSGVALTNTDYWTVVFDLEQFVTKANNNFTIRVEEQTTLNATFATNKGEWVIWGGVLYEALSNIIDGDQYVENSNIKRITVEAITGDLIDLDTVNKTNLVAAINEIFSAIGDISNLSTTDKTSLVNAINETYDGLTREIQNRIDAIAAEAQTRADAIAAEAQTRADNDTAITNNFNDKIGDLDNLNTVAKNNLVSAINEVNTKASAANYYVTPEDYGAQGGSADDTAAVQAAINDGRPVIFTQDYNCTHIDIPYSTTRLIVIDGQNHWLNYIGDGETEFITFKGIYCSLQNMCLNNKTTDANIGIYWTSNSTSEPAEYNTFENVKVFNFNTGIYYGDYNGIIDTSMSENSLIGYITRGCNIPLFVNMANAIINITNSQLISMPHECLYTFDNNRSCCIRNESGAVLITNSELVKPSITAGYGIYGQNITITNSVVEFTCRWVLGTGNISLSHIRGGYYNNTLPPFVLHPTNFGTLTLDDIVINYSALVSNQRLVEAVGGVGNTNWNVNIINSFFNNYIANYNPGLSQFPFSIKTCCFNDKTIKDTMTYSISSNNYNKLTPLNGSLTADNTGIVTLTANATNPNFTTPKYNVGQITSFLINVTAMSGAWTLYGNYTAADESTASVYYPLSAGVNNMVLMPGAVSASNVQFAVASTEANASISFNKIVVNAENEA